MAKLAIQQDLPIPISPALGLQMLTARPDLYVGDEDLNSHSNTYTAHILPTSSSPWASWVTFFFIACNVKEIDLQVFVNL